MVRTRTGEGTYVAEDAGKFLGRVLGHGLLNTEKDLDDVAESRMCLEAESVGLCAERRTDEDVRKLDHVLYQQQQSYRAWRRRFSAMGPGTPPLDR